MCAKTQTAAVVLASYISLQYYSHLRQCSLPQMLPNRRDLILARGPMECVEALQNRLVAPETKDAEDCSDEQLQLQLNLVKFHSTLLRGSGF